MTDDVPVTAAKACFSLGGGRVIRKVKYSCPLRVVNSPLNVSLEKGLFFVSLQSFSIKEAQMHQVIYI